MNEFEMTDEQLKEVSSGNRVFTEKEKAWALDTHDFLFEYVPTQGGGSTLSDTDLAKEIENGSLDYARCTSM